MEEMICGEIVLDLWWIQSDHALLEVFRAELSCRQLEMWELIKTT